MSDDVVDIEKRVVNIPVVTKDVIVTKGPNGEIMLDIETVQNIMDQLIDRATKLACAFDRPDDWAFRENMDDLLDHEKWGWPVFGTDCRVKTWKVERELDGGRVLVRFLACCTVGDDWGITSYEWYHIDESDVVLSMEMPAPKDVDDEST